jgi:cytochrome c-type biogenesis protein CcmH/NrfG
MGPDVINGLPAHVFLVHIVVIFVPLAALLLILSALWPSARRRLGIVTPLVALVAVAAIPPTTNAGSWLIKRVPHDPLVSAHAKLADGLLPWVIGMFVFAAAIWVLWAKQHWFLRTDKPGEVELDKQQALVSSTVGGSGGGAEEAGEQTVVTTAAAVAARPAPGWMRIVRVVAVVVALAVSVGSVVEVYRIGDAGAKAAWQGQFSQTPVGPPPGK